MVELVLQKLAPLDPAKDFVFMVRAGGFAPGILRCWCSSIRCISTQ